MKTHRNAVKMYCVLLCELVNSNEKAEKLSANLKVKTKKPKSGDKAKTNSKAFDWGSHKGRVMSAIADLLECDAIYQLWHMASPEPELGSLCFTTASSVLENKENLSAARKDLRAATFRLWCSSVKRFNLHIRATSCLLHLLHNYDFLPTHLADLCELAQNKYDLNRVVGDILREVGRLDVKMLARDSSGARSVGDFLNELAARVPAQVLQFASVLLPHLDGESYLIRNGVVQMVGQLLEKATFPDANAEENGDEDSTGQAAPKSPTKKKKNAKTAKKQHKDKAAKKKRRGRKDESSEEEESNYDESEEDDEEKDEEDEDEEEEEQDEAMMGMAVTSRSREALFVLLEQRVHDVTSFTRAKVMQIWVQLCEARAVPIERLPGLVLLAAERCRDKAAQVRKYAVMLLTTLLQYNPFHANLSGSQHKARCTELATNFKDAMSKRVADFEANEKKAQDLIMKRKPEKTVPDESDSESGTADMQDEEQSESKPAMSESEKELAESVAAANEAIATLKKDLDRSFAAVKFIEAIDASVPDLAALVGSKTATDVLECIKFFVTAHEFQIDRAEIGINAMLTLVWSKQQNVKEAVLEAYHRLYIGDVADLDGVRQQKLAAIIARNLVRLTHQATLAHLTSLEELMSKLMINGQIPEAVTAAMWDMFSSASNSITSTQRAGALQLLTMMANSKPSIIMEKLSLVVSVGLGPRAKHHQLLARAACQALQRGCKGSNLGAKNVSTIVAKLVAIILNDQHVHPVTGDARDARNWYSAAEQAVNAIFALHRHPDVLCARVVATLASRALGSEVSSAASNGADVDDSMDVDSESWSAGVGSAEALSRLFFLVGHVAIKVLVRLEEKEALIKRLRHHNEREKAAKKEKEASKKKNKNKDVDDKEAIENELAVGASEEYELEQMRDRAEKMLLLGKSSLLGAFGPLVVRVVSQPAKFKHAMLQRSASLALCKLMCLNAGFCEDQLQLLFTVLQNTRDPRVRSNLVVAIGDLAFRFPNQMEPWSGHMFGPLRDTDKGVRKNTLMVLSHLILNDMLKAKGPVNEITRCLCDESEKIADLAKIFFTELSHKGKDRAIYNILPDVISTLSAADDVSDDQFKSIMKFLMGFINKDKQTESLIEKLCRRLHNANSGDTEAAHKKMLEPTRIAAEVEATVNWHGEVDLEIILEPIFAQDRLGQAVERSAAEIRAQMCRDVAYCMAQLTISKTSLKTLMDGLRHYQSKLGDDEVYMHFTDLVTKCKKFAKAEMTEMLVSYEQMLAEARDKAAQDRDAEHKAGKARRRKAKAGADDDEDDDDLESAMQNLIVAAEETQKANKGKRKKAVSKEESAKPAAKKKPAAAKKKPVARRKKKKVTSSEEGEEEESSEDEVEPEPEPAPKRGRGRAAAKKAPPKGKAAAAKKAPARGRTKKKAEPSSSEEESDDSVASMESDEE